MHKIKKIVDLSWEFTADTPIYPGDPEPSVTVATTLENEGYNLSTLVMGTQTGSHVDAPYHFSNEGVCSWFDFTKMIAEYSGHTECDAIIMDDAKILAVPGLEANDVDAALIHEAAIGKIAGEQLIKLMTLGLTEEEAENQIINGFLK